MARRNSVPKMVCTAIVKNKNDLERKYDAKITRLAAPGPE